MKRIIKSAEELSALLPGAVVKAVWPEGSGIPPFTTVKADEEEATHVGTFGVAGGGYWNSMANWGSTLYLLFDPADHKAEHEDTVTPRNYGIEGMIDGEPGAIWGFPKVPQLDEDDSRTVLGKRIEAERILLLKGTEVFTIWEKETTGKGEES